MDFKYWEDTSDAFRPGEGSLLPLWRFASDKSRRRQVRARLCARHALRAASGALA